MLNQDYIAFHHARALMKTGGEPAIHQDLAQYTTPTVGLCSELPGMHMTIPRDLNTTGTRHVFISTVGQRFGNLSIVDTLEDLNVRIGSVWIADRARLYESLFKPAESQDPSLYSLWNTQAERPSPAQDYVANLVRPSPALKAPVVEKFSRLVAEWRNTRNPVGSVSDICSNFAYQKIIGMGQDAMPLILRELDRSLDHWFWALAAITGANPVKEEHRGRLNLMAQDWFSWAKQQGYQW